jgi:pSer/pThr/pTyr-binding forkhead associated (FHA) protein
MNNTVVTKQRTFSFKTGLWLVYSQTGLKDTEKNRVVHLDRGQIMTIGSGKGVDLQIADRFMSRRHLRISWVNNEPLIEDLGSTNGTVVNGTTLAGVMLLQTPAVVRMGLIRMTLFDAVRLDRGNGIAAGNLVAKGEHLVPFFHQALMASREDTPVGKFCRLCLQALFLPDVTHADTDAVRVDKEPDANGVRYLVTSEGGGWRNQLERSACSGHSTPPEESGTCGLGPRGL